MSYERDKALLINRLNGSRLAAANTSLQDGLHVVAVRYTRHDQNPQRWTCTKLGEENQWTVVRFEITDGSNTFCLDSGESPEIGYTGDDWLRIKTPDDSDRQKWLIREDWAETKHVFNIAPYLNTSCGVSLKDNFGNLSHDEVVLARNFSSLNQLWYWNGAHYKDEIPK